MGIAVELTATTEAVTIPGSGVQLRAPGLVGDVIWSGARRTTEMRAETAESSLLKEAIAEAGLDDRHTLEVNAETPTPEPGYQRTTTDEVAPNELEIDIPVSGDELQFIIYTDEDGVTTIHFPKPPAVPSQA